jgi:SAM-dependent methyltransferase
VRGAAERLPFPDQTFDVALALMTVHHWADLRQGLAELRRVAPRQVVFTFDPVVHDSLWIFQEYVPGIIDMTEASLLEVVVEELQADRVEVVPVPADCTDGFLTAYWRRPECYLDPSRRASTSGFARLPEALVAPGLERLASDLDSGAWHRRHHDLLTCATVDAGLRLVVAG